VQVSDIQAGFQNRFAGRGLLTAFFSAALPILPDAIAPNLPRDSRFAGGSSSGGFMVLSRNDAPFPLILSEMKRKTGSFCRFRRHACLLGP